MFTKEVFDGNDICLQLDDKINDDSLIDEILIFHFFFHTCENVCLCVCIFSC
jgi:hypothetical protein